MTPEEASAWLSTIKSLYRYSNCTIDYSDTDSVRKANLAAEKRARVVAPNLTAISQEKGNVVRPRQV
jgi:hypothetical protein